MLSRVKRRNQGEFRRCFQARQGSLVVLCAGKASARNCREIKQ
jgi:hypothetical protein